MEYITPQEAAEKWGIGLRRVQFFCANDNIPGVIRVGRQWLIPNTAEKPADKRKRIIRRTVNYDAYHFPVFCISRFYSAKTELSPNELLILDAQLLALKGQYLDCVTLCRRVLAEDSNPSVLFAAYATNAFCLNMLGLLSENLDCINHMEAISRDNPVHEEDYRLVIEACKFHRTFDYSGLLNICTQNLSSDALVFFNYCIMQVALFSDKPIALDHLKSFEVICKQMEILGCLPALMTTHHIIFHLYNLLGNGKKHENHLKEACRIGYEQGYITLLSKYCTINSKEMYVNLKEYGVHFLNRVEKEYQNNIRNWRVVFNSSNETNYVQDLSKEENELMLLLFRNLTNQEIANLKGISKAEAASLVKNLYRKLNFSSKSELISYIESIFKDPAITNMEQQDNE